MIIIWRGFGIAAIPVAMVCFLCVDRFFQAVLGLEYCQAHEWPKLIGLAASGASVFALGHLLGDEHELFFVPLRMVGLLSLSALMIWSAISFARPDRPATATPTRGQPTYRTVAVR